MEIDQMFTRMILSTLGAAAIAAMPLCARAADVSKTDAEFLKMAAEADMTTTHIGKMAEDRAATTEIKDYGKKLAQDHTSDYGQVAELAAKVGADVPKGIDKVDDRQIASLDKLKGKTFDRTFLTQETAEHERLIKAFQQEAEHGSNADIKDYANKALPVIQGHLHDAQDLLKTKAHKA
jgi:putative membrane protein